MVKKPRTHIPSKLLQKNSTSTPLFKIGASNLRITAKFAHDLLLPGDKEVSLMLEFREL